VSLSLGTPGAFLSTFVAWSMRDVIAATVARGVERATVVLDTRRKVGLSGLTCK